MARLTPEQHKLAVGIVQMGATHVFIARIFGAAIIKLMQRYRLTGRSGMTTPRSRSKCLTCTVRASCCSARLSRAQVPTFACSSVRDEDRYLRILHLRSRFLIVTPSATNALGDRVSQQTLARRLEAYRIRAYRHRRKHLLTMQNCCLRLRWVLTTMLAAT